MAAIVADAVGNFGAMGAMIGSSVASQSQPKNPPLTSIVIGPGAADNNTSLGGNAPHVALWNRKGDRIDQWTPHPDPKKNKDMILEGQTFPINLRNAQIDGNQADPEYVMLSMNDDNALCVAAIQAASNSVSWSWYGDIGRKCGAQWFYSDKPYGSDAYQPACTWISGPDHPHGYKYQGLAVHMPDFNADPGLVKEYNDHPDAVCNSVRRFHMYENIVPDALIPVFLPPLVMKADGSDTDLSKVIDKKKSAPHRKRDAAKERSKKRGNNNNDPSMLIITEHDNHSAKDICDSHTAVGPDLVSMNEKLYCDMSMGQVWPLCDSSLKSGCFDLVSKTLKGVKQRRDEEGNVLADKAYSNTQIWSKSG